MESNINDRKMLKKAIAGKGDVVMRGNLATWDINSQVDQGTNKSLTWRLKSCRQGPKIERALWAWNPRIRSMPMFSCSCSRTHANFTEICQYFTGTFSSYAKTWSRSSRSSTCPRSPLCSSGPSHAWHFWRGSVPPFSSWEPSDGLKSSSGSWGSGRRPWFGSYPLSSAPSRMWSASSST